MSTPDPLFTSWRERARIDYFSLFVPLWFSVNAWMLDRYTVTRDRSLLEELKLGGHELADEFAGLVQSEAARGNSFRANLGELHWALETARIPYEGRFSSRTVGLGCCAIDWNNGNPQFDSVLRNTPYEPSPNDELEDSEEADSIVQSEYKNIELVGGLWVENNPLRVFAAYIEVVYQVRCALFHGRLELTPQNERVVKHIYLTLSEVMEVV